MKEALTSRDQKIIWHPFTQAKTAPPPIAVIKASGSYLYTDSGKKLFDGISSWWINAHGHCHPYINKAIEKQLKTLEHVIFTNFTHEPAVTLAEKLLKVVPKNLTRVFYSDNGSTAVEIAVKMALQYWLNKNENRNLIVTLEHSYHGDTFGSMSVSERSTFTKPFWPFLFKVITTKSTCVCEVTLNRSKSDITNFAINQFAEILSKYKNQIAAIIVEPMLQAAGGMKIFTTGFLSAISKLCTKHDILLIADEAATGFYRTGKFFAIDHENIKPDIMCVAKCLTGGFLPLAATLTSEKIYHAFLSDKKSDALLHGHSFTANPLGCAAAIASLELFESKETTDNINSICDAIKNGAHRFNDLPSVANVRSIGSLLAIELLSKEKGYLSNDAENIYKKCFEKGLYIRPLGNVIYLLPPFCSTKQEIDWALQTIYNAIEN